MIELRRTELVESRIIEIRFAICKGSYCCICYILPPPHPTPTFFLKSLSKSKTVLTLQDGRKQFLTNINRKCSDAKYSQMEMMTAWIHTESFLSIQLMAKHLG